MTCRWLAREEMGPISGIPARPWILRFISHVAIYLGALITTCGAFASAAFIFGILIRGFLGQLCLPEWETAYCLGIAANILLVAGFILVVIHRFYLWWQHGFIVVDFIVFLLGLLAAMFLICIHIWPSMLPE